MDNSFIARTCTVCYCISSYDDMNIIRTVNHSIVPFTISCHTNESCGTYIFNSFTPKEVHPDALYHTYITLLSHYSTMEYLFLEWENSIMRLCAKLSGMLVSNAPHTVLKRFYKHTNTHTLAYKFLYYGLLTIT